MCSSASYFVGSLSRKPTTTAVQQCCTRALLATPLDAGEREIRLVFFFKFSKTSNITPLELWELFPWSRRYKPAAIVLALRSASSLPWLCRLQSRGKRKTTLPAVARRHSLQDARHIPSFGSFQGYSEACRVHCIVFTVPCLISSQARHRFSRCEVLAARQPRRTYWAACPREPSPLTVRRGRSGSPSP